AERVIDLFERTNIHEKYLEILFRIVAVFENEFAKNIAEFLSVREPGERIVMSGVLEILFAFAESYVGAFFFLQSFEKLIGMMLRFAPAVAFGFGLFAFGLFDAFYRVVHLVDRLAVVEIRKTHYGERDRGRQDIAV